MFNISTLKKYYRSYLFVIFLFIWAWSSWHPASSQNWFVENNVTFLFIPIVFGVSIWYIRFSKLSFTLVTIFLILHTIGSHYNYGSVPFGNTLSSIFGVYGNIYDKFVHFSFGFLVFYPLRELFLRTSLAKGLWSYILPFNAILGCSALYEIFEWVTVLRLSPSVAYLFIGGNDPFDTTKDMSASMVGALVALIIVYLLEIIKSRKATASVD